MRRWFLLAGLGLLVAGGVWWWSGGLNPRKPLESTREIGEKAVKAFTGGGFNVTPDTPGYETYLELQQGCPYKDCIPSIDEPKFESRDEADKWLEDEDVVFGLDYKGEQRAYPQRILNWHEIVNDVVGGEAVVISFCPLCGSSLAFERRIQGRTLEFGVSGKLHNSDLVMYDRETESLWQQITGEAIVGELAGKRLGQIPMDTLRWGEWKTTHPGTRVLSRDTGYSRDYSAYPYGNYEQSGEVMFPVEGGVDRTLHPKTVVYGIAVKGKAKAYTLEAIKRETKEDGVLSDRVGGERLRLSYSNGEVVVENLSNKRERIVPTRLFWFAWRAFHPETEIYK